MWKKITGDVGLSISAIVIYNGCIQLLLYPMLEKQMGAVAFGVVLAFVSVMAIMASSFGTGCNYARMVNNMRETDCNGDYQIILGMISFLAIPVSVIACFCIEQGNFIQLPGIILLMIVTMWRYYSDVDFRLRLDYKGFFLFYLLIAIGYGIGACIYSWTDSWILAFLLGEAAALVFVFYKGTIYEKPWFRKSKLYKESLKSCMLLSASNLLSALSLHLDRLLILWLIDAKAVTIFYAATLVGKIIALLTVPLNSIIISYLAKYKEKINGIFYTKIAGGLLMVALGFEVISVGVSDLFVKWMYADVFTLVQPLFWLANAGQIMFFVTSTLMVVALKFMHEKYQVYLNLIYIILYLLISVPATMFAGVWGMGWAILSVNVIRFILAFSVGIYQIKRTMKDERN